MRPDPPPGTITRGRHYSTSNEDKHDLFREVVAGRGGIQIGVGAEQNWLLAGWSEPEIVVCVDFDDWIVQLNRVYGMFFRHLESPAQFLEAWSQHPRTALWQWLEEEIADPAERTRIRGILNDSVGDVENRMKFLASRHAELGVASILNNAAMYGKVRNLWLEGRVLSLQGNLVGKDALHGVAEFGRRFGIPVRTVYLSNAEEYFEYGTGAFRANLAELPFDDRSVILHTKPHHGVQYRYVWEPAVRFQAWLSSGRVNRFCELFDFAAKEAALDGSGDAFSIRVDPGTVTDPSIRRCRRF